MIQGYPDQTSIYPGQQLQFFVSTDAPQFRMDFYRYGPTFSLLLSSSWLAGVFADDHDCDVDWGEPGTRADGKAVDGWSSYPFVIPGNWSTGVYIAMFVEGDGQGNAALNQQPPLDRSTPDARTGKALFVVKNPNPGYDSLLLYKLPLFTYQMYNMSRYTGIDGQVHAGAGYSFEITATNIAYAGTVTLRRPGGGTGGTPWDSMYFPFPGQGNLDPLDPSSYRQTFVHWDAKMIMWLESNGYRVDYCTDLDVHLDTDLSLLSSYSLVLSIGHDEYYTESMRDNLETYIARGGNIAFFSGNTCYWHLFFPRSTPTGQPDLRFIVRDYVWAQYPTAQAPDAPGRPEDSLTGVGFRNGGERNYPLPDASDTYVGFTVQNTHLWPFESSGLAENQTMAEGSSLVGYEADGTPYDQTMPRPVSPSFNAADATPPGLVILGTGETGTWPGWSKPGWSGAATMAMYQNRGTAFTGATTDWPRLLADGDKHCESITHHVIDRLGGSPKGLASLATIGGLIACDGFYSGDDKFRHAIVGCGNGDIWEVFFNPNSGQGQVKLDSLPGLLDIGAFYTPDDHRRHVIAALNDGSLFEIYYAPAAGISRAILGTFPGTTRVAGFYSADDKFRHAIIGLQNGQVVDVSFNPEKGQQTISLGTFDQIVDVAGFYSSDDDMRHAIVATAAGDVYEIYYNSQRGPLQTLLGNFPYATRIGAFFADGDSFFNRRVVVATNSNRLHQFKFSPGAGALTTLLITLGDLSDVGGFYSDDDHDRHVIVGSAGGLTRELFYREQD